jgi:hypothetical protein
MSQADTKTLILRLTMTDIEEAAYNTYGKLRADVRAVRDGATYEQTPDTWLWSHESVFADLVMMVYYGTPTVSDGYAYGPVEVGYESPSITRELEAARFHKGLSRISRAYEKLVKELGRPQSCGHEVAYYMKLIGVKTACVKAPAGKIGGLYRDYNLLRSPESVRAYIDASISAFRSARMAQPAAA